MRTTPESTFSSPASTISRVDLPDPDGPTMPTTSPLSTVRPTLLRTCTRDAPSPSVNDTSFNSMTGSAKDKLSYMEGKAKDALVIWGLTHGFQTSLRRL